MTHMEIKLNQPIPNFEDEPIKQGDKEVTYGTIIRNILGAPSEKDNGDKKMKKYKLGLKCVADVVDLDLDERKLIKDLADEVGLNPLIYGRICELMEESNGTPPKNEE